jgi:phosphoglycerol transferase MdoB-like AlkP superfamily enzyme
LTEAAGGYLRFLMWAVGVTAVTVLAGWLPTRRLGGEEAIPAMLAGCAVSLLASALGGVPIALARRASAAPARMQALLMSMALRFGAVVVLALAAVLSGLFHTAPLLLWVAIGYAVQLVVETRYALAKDDVEIR